MKDVFEKHWRIISTVESIMTKPCIPGNSPGILEDVQKRLGKKLWQPAAST